MPKKLGVIFFFLRKKVDFFFFLLDFLRPAFGHGRLGHPQSLEYCYFIFLHIPSPGPTVVRKCYHRGLPWNSPMWSYFGPGGLCAPPMVAMASVAGHGHSGGPRKLIIGMPPYFNQINICCRLCVLFFYFLEPAIGCGHLDQH